MIETPPKTISSPVVLTTDELEVLEALRRLKPYGSLKISKNQNGSQLTLTVEDHYVVPIEKK